MIRVNLLIASAPLAIAAPASTVQINGSGVSAPMQILLFLTALTFLPAVIMSITPFLRITIVLHFLRQALGTQTAPSNQVLLGLALFLTALIMNPVAAEIYSNAWEPYDRGALTASQALEQGSAPMKSFLLKFAREKDISLLIDLTKSPRPASHKDIPLNVLVPAYILSELKTGFQIGAVLFLPFLIIDVVIASVTLSIGMVQLPPVMLSAPFKILLFVLVDGWNLVVGSLVRSFY